jgi:hypothetical protein
MMGVCTCACFAVLISQISNIADMLCTANSQSALQVRHIRHHKRCERMCATLDHVTCHLPPATAVSLYVI